MNTLKAVIVDVYQTLLDVAHHEGDREEAWKQLYREFFDAPPEMTLEHLAERCRHIVSEDHSQAHHFGVAHPEVVWIDVMRRALPEFANLPEDRGEDFLFHHIQLLRTLRLAPGCTRLMQICRERGIMLGIVSNAQPYTLRELDTLLRTGGESLGSFEKDLCLWSFENGFSKPDPHVFRLLAFRLQRRGIRPEETLVVGDRRDNDIEPSEAQGFQTWWINDSLEGNWPALLAARFGHSDASQQTP